MKKEEPIIKSGSFDKVIYSSDKVADFPGELVLTINHLYIKSRRWSSAFFFDAIQMEERNGLLAIMKNSGRVLFKLQVKNAKEWQEISLKLFKKKVEIIWLELELSQATPVDFSNLLDVGVERIKKMYYKRQQNSVLKHNINFNISIMELLRNQKNRKLKSYMLAHSFATWYEWTKTRLNEIYKCKFGKGPMNDEELLKFMEQYPKLHPFAIFNEAYGINANQIRNCIAHEKYFFDYKNNELVFVFNRECRISLRDLEQVTFMLANFVTDLEVAIREVALTGELSIKARKQEIDLFYRKVGWASADACRETILRAIDSKTRELLNL